MGVYYKVNVDKLKSGVIRDIGLGAWAVISALASYMDRNGRCYPSQKRLASDLGVTRQTVIRYLKQLHAAGYVIKERNEVGTITYVLNSDKSGIEKFTTSDKVTG